VTWLPVVTRELKAEARHPLNSWLRLATALLLLLALIILADGFSLGQGGLIFIRLNQILLVSIWIVVPLLTGDCLSRERREGTLGLLFLTPLKPAGIVIGKSLTHALRALTFVLVAFPILAIPILLGGVNGRHIIEAMLLNGCALFFALSAGLIASSYCREWNRALLLAEFLSALFAGTVLYLRIVNQHSLGGLRFGFFPLAGYSLSFYPSAPRLPGGRQLPWLEPGLFLLSALAFVLAILIAANRLRKTWMDQVPSRQQLWLLRIFCTPFVLPTFFRRRMRRKLNRNPIIWLQDYSWSARLSKWGWFLLITIIETFLITTIPGLVLSRFWIRPQSLLIELIGLGLAFSAVGSFRREKLNGALELLLVTPLREIQIIGGRLWGIWTQFFPAVLLLGIIWLFIFQRYNFALSEGLEKYAFPVKCLFILLCVPIIGFYLSLHRLNFLFGWLITCLLGLVLPSMVRIGFLLICQKRDYLWASPHFNLLGLCSEWATQLILAVVCFVLLFRNLKNRSFALIPA